MIYITNKLTKSMNQKFQQVRKVKVKTQDFLKRAKCFNDQCSNKDLKQYIKHGERNNKNSKLQLFKCKKCNSVFGVNMEELYT